MASSVLRDRRGRFAEQTRPEADTALHPRDASLPADEQRRRAAHRTARAAKNHEVAEAEFFQPVRDEILGRRVVRIRLPYNPEWTGGRARNAQACWDAASKSWTVGEAHLPQFLRALRDVYGDRAVEDLMDSF